MTRRSNQVQNAIDETIGLIAAGKLIDRVRARERERGFAIIPPGARPWLPKADWRSDTVISIRAMIFVRLVLLAARDPGSGALRRTLRGLEEAGLRPEVIEPTPRLAAYLSRLGWVYERRGSTFYDRETVWIPK